MSKKHMRMLREREAREGITRSEALRRFLEEAGAAGATGPKVE